MTGAEKAGYNCCFFMSYLLCYASRLLFSLSKKQSVVIAYNGQYV